MMNSTRQIHIETIGQLHELLGVEKPRHPLFSILRFEEIPDLKIDQRTKLVTDFYQFTLKAGRPCKIQYGQSFFDFDEGIISCFAPKQVSILDTDFQLAKSGWQVSIHPDFLRAHVLGAKIKQYGFFEYNINEALILSDIEQQAIEMILKQVETEYRLPIDNFTQDLISSHLDLVFNYCNRYYCRQFVTRKPLNDELLMKFELTLEKAISDAKEHGLPTVTKLAQKMNLSTKYLSDCLKQLTGQTAKQIIQDRIIERSKDILATTNFTVGEIAFSLGFEQSQSFNKFFKNRVDLTPLDFRKSFN